MTKTVLITGATGGIGAAMARGFAAAGYRVIIAYRKDADAAENLRAALCADNKNDGGHYHLPLVVDDADSVAAAFAEIKNNGGLSLLINNAGFTRFVPPEDLHALDDDLIDGIFRVHVRGMLACTRHAAPLLRENKNGAAIINISSVAATIAIGSNIAYCAAKAAVNNLTLSLARALAPDIRVNAIAPGLVDTPFIRNLDKDWHSQQVKKTPMGRLTTPDEVATCALVLAEKMPTCTGMVLPIDGGRKLAA